jgi:hypothetical protein
MKTQMFFVLVHSSFHFLSYLPRPVLETLRLICLPKKKAAAFPLVAHLDKTVVMLATLGRRLSRLSILCLV